MKDKIKYVLLFIGVFVLCYLVICFLIPAFRIKLSATPIVYIFESLKHNALIKLMISFIISLIAVILTLTADNIKIEK